MGLIDAFVQVVRQYPDVVLDIVGPIGNYPLEENFDLHNDRAHIQIAPFYDMGFWSFISRQ